MPKKLTPRQSAVLAAIDRRGGAATLLDLRDDFPEIAPSAVARVLDALESRDLICRRGDPSQIYVGGVTFRSPTRTLDQRNARLVDLKELFEANGWAAYVEEQSAAGEGPAVVVLLPLDEVNKMIRGRESALTRLRDFIVQLEDDYWSQSAVESDVAFRKGRPHLKVAFVNTEPSDAEWKQIDEADQIG